jgi:hypothetical protein
MQYKGNSERKPYLPALSDGTTARKSRISSSSWTGAAALAEVDNPVLALVKAVADGPDARLALRVAAARRRVQALTCRRLRPGANAALVAARPPARVHSLLLLMCCSNQRSAPFV